MFRKHRFLEYFSTMAFIGSVEKDSITTQDSFKNCVLACKISNQRHKSFEKRKTWRQIVGARNCLLEIMSLRAIILHKIDFCALLINTFEKLHLINSEANLRRTQYQKQSFLWHQIMPLTNVTRRSIIDVAGILDTPLKLVTINSSKVNNCKTMSTKELVKQFFGGHFSVRQFSWDHFFGGQFSGRGAISLGVYFWGSFFREAFFPGAFFRTLLGW